MQGKNGGVQSPWHLEIVDELDSTSETLKRRAETGAAETALLARRQRAGHGRMGRLWASLDGNLHLSVLLRPQTLRWPGHWSLLAGVALAQAVRASPGANPPIHLKWPNDLLLEHRKAAGILVEAGTAAGSVWLVIGFGVNLKRAPEGLDRAVACLDDFSPAPAPETFARALLDALAAWRHHYEQDGFEPVRTAWLALGPQIGDKLLAAGRAGHFRGLARDGALLLEDENGVREVRTGELD